jgi:hypothetical protein
MYTDIPAGELRTVMNNLKNYALDEHTFTEVLMLYYIIVNQNYFICDKVLFKQTWSSNGLPLLCSSFRNLLTVY